MVSLILARIHSVILPQQGNQRTKNQGCVWFESLGRGDDWVSKGVCGHMQHTMTWTQSPKPWKSCKERLHKVVFWAPQAPWCAMPPPSQKHRNKVFLKWDRLALWWVLCVFLHHGSRRSCVSVLKILNFIYVYGYYSYMVCVCTTCIQCPEESKRGCQVLWDCRLKSF